MNLTAFRSLLTVGCVLLLCAGGCSSYGLFQGGIKCPNKTEAVVDFEMQCREGDPADEKETYD